jgi:hypothetical protein
MTENSDKTYERGATLHSACECCELLAIRIHELENYIQTLHGYSRRERVGLKDADWEAFIRVLDESPAPNDALREFLARNPRGSSHLTELQS